ncbi:MAG: hypothetical protein IJ560_01560 [Alphaproteobacteria bacterium]|nr:hypothetical protein [Alphaproteobacteria bacterium]
MKTYKNLWNQFISTENFDLAARRAIKNKKSRRAVRAFMANRNGNLRRLREQLMRGEYTTSQYRTFRVFEPKERLIYVLPLYPDHIVQHALINILGPIWQRMFVRDSYACISGRGLHAASKRTMQFVRRNKYVLQCDIRKFYPSIDHEILMQIIRHKINDVRIVALLENIVRSGGAGKNMPIGNLTSQWLGNVYMNELDMFVKHVLRWHDYIRYCDDFCLYGNDSHMLHVAAWRIREFVREKLNMDFSRFNVGRVACGVSFIGYRHFPRFIMLRRRGALKIRRRIIRIITSNDTRPLAIGRIAAARGWIKWACTYNLRQFIMRHVSHTTNQDLVQQLRKNLI